VPYTATAPAIGGGLMLAASSLAGKVARYCLAGSDQPRADGAARAGSGWAVQRESTATGADLTGLVRTLWDGDLHRRTAVDVLPSVCKQGAGGSNPPSSTRPKT
jgi:hypothetical protein